MMKIEIKGFLNEGALRVRGLGGQLPPSLSKNAIQKCPHPQKIQISFSIFPIQLSQKLLDIFSISLSSINSDQNWDTFDMEFFY